MSFWFHFVGEKLRSKMQNRVDALFKQIARDSEYFDRGAAV